MFFFDNTKKTSTKHPSSSKAISNPGHPFQNDKPRGDPDSRYHDSPKEESTTVSTHAPAALREKDNVHTQSSMVLTKEKELHSQLLALQDLLDTSLNTSEARGKDIERLKEEVHKLDSIVTSKVSAEKLAESKIRELETEVLQRDENILKMQEVLNTTLNTSKARGKK